jgi:hypothetical protein
MKRAIFVFCGTLLCGAIFVTGARAQAPCCSIAAVDARTGIVSAKVNADGAVFQFRVTNANLLKQLRVGQGVYANFTTHEVSLDGKTIAGPIISGPQAPAPSPAAPVPAPVAPRPAAAVGAPLAIVPLPRIEDLPLKGVLSPDSENKNGESDPRPNLTTVHAYTLPTLRAGAKTERLRDDPDAKTILQELAKDLGGVQINVALLGGRKYMINNCLGVKASAGNFNLGIPDPDLRIAGTGIDLTFTVSRVSFNALSVRVRPDITNILGGCSFSGTIGVGGTADQVSLELQFDPILDLERCQVGSMGQIHWIWGIGSFTLSPLPGEVGVVAKDMIVDSLNYATNFNITDRIAAGLTALIGAKCHR